MRILDIKENFRTSEMPLPQSKTHRLFLLRIKYSIIQISMVSVSTIFDNFRRPVEGAMKLLRAWFSYFQSIFHLARVDHCNYTWKNHLGIIMCILGTNLFWEFSDFVEGVLGHMNLW
jgi:hypothetical protein